MVVLLCNRGQTFTCQACTFWKWGKFLEDVTPRGKTLVRINLDETSVAYVPDTIRGLVVPRRHWGPYGRRPVVRSKKTRGAVTYVSLNCDSPSLQPKLPQFILGNERRLTRHMLAVAEDERPPNVRVWRDKSSWNNHTVMCRILRALASVLRTQAPYFQPVLVLDVAACHLHASVMQTASNLGIWLHFVPAKLTFLLQPLDTHCFTTFKFQLRRMFSEARSRSQNGDVTPVEWLRILMALPKQVLAAHVWRPAFEQNGLGGARPCRDAVQSLTDSVCQDELLSCFPTVDELQAVWPKARKLEYDRALLLKPVLRQWFEDDSTHPAASSSSASSRAVPLPDEVPMSIALASRVHARACRRYPVRGTGST